MRATFLTAGILALTSPALAQHPYYPLKLGAVWEYRFPNAVDPAFRDTIYQTDKVIDINEAEHTYTLERTNRIATLPPDKATHVYELRGGNILHTGQTTGWQAAAFGIDPGFRFKIPAPIVLKANLTKGARWKEGPPEGMRECEVLDFVTVKVPAGEYKNVAKLLVKVPYINSETKRQEYGPTSYEYYAPDIGLVKTEVREKDGRALTFIELVRYIPGSP